MRRVAMLSFAMLGFGSADLAVAQAAPAPHFRPSFDRCMEASGGVTVAVRDCIGAEYAFQDAVLNARYNVLLARLNPRHRTVLRESQRRWLQRREADCAKDFGVGDGTLADTTRDQCMLGNLVERIDWLNRFRP